MAQTQAALEAALPHDLAIIVHNYLCTSCDPFSVGYYGHYEIAMFAPDELACIHGACRGGHIEIARAMLDRGSDTDFDISLDAACRGGHLDIVKLLIERGPTDLNLNYGLLSASLNQYDHVIEYLKGLGAVLPNMMRLSGLLGL